MNNIAQNICEHVFSLIKSDIEVKAYKCNGELTPSIGDEIYTNIANSVGIMKGSVCYNMYMSLIKNNLQR